MPVKTDRIEARNIACAMQVGWYRPVHLKRPEARKLRLLLSSRQMLLRTRIDLDNHIRGMLKAFGLKVGKVAACPVTPMRSADHHGHRPASISRAAPPAKRVRSLAHRRLAGRAGGCRLFELQLTKPRSFLLIEGQLAFCSHARSSAQTLPAPYYPRVPGMLSAKRGLTYRA
jgi:hypothetical protein